MHLCDLLEGWVEHAPDIAIKNITQDPRLIREGSVFVTTQKGGKSRAECLEAVLNGCSAILHDASAEMLGLPVPVVPVVQLNQRLGEMASRFWAAPSDLMTVAAVAGLDDRAAVSHYLAQVWQRSRGRGGLFGSLGRGPVDTLRPLDLASADVFGLNETLATCVDAGIEHVAVEVSTQSLQQECCQTLQVDLAVITGFDRATESMGAERRLLTEFAPTFAVVNLDDAPAQQYIDEFGGFVEILSVGLDSDAELSASIVTTDETGMALRFRGPWGEADVLTDLQGEEAARNLLLLAGSLVLLGMDWYEVCRQIEYVRPAPRSTAVSKVRGRWERAA